jgi:general stress protein YciG
MKLTKAEKAIIARMGRKGGKRRAAALTPERRSEIAKMGSDARTLNASLRREAGKTA